MASRVRRSHVDFDGAARRDGDVAAIMSTVADLVCCGRGSGTATNLYWWIKGLLTSTQEANAERMVSEFDANEWPMLRTGGVFALVDPGDVDVSAEPKSMASVAIKEVSKLIGSAKAEKKLPVKPYQVLVRLVRATPSAKQTYVEWTTLELDANKPKFASQVPLYKVQTIKERNGGIGFFTATGEVLFEAKSLTEQASVEAGKWVHAFQRAMVALAPAIEEESAIATGRLDRAQRLELLDEKRKRAEEAKAKLGVVTMAHSAKILASR